MLKKEAFVQGNSVCANVSSPGSYFAVMVAPAADTTEPFDASTRMQAMGSACLYGVVQAFAILQV